MWTNKRFGKKKFKGSYDTAKKSKKRILVLTYSENGVVKVYESFESWQKAKKDGWVRVK